MEFIKYNANPKNYKAGDCVVRSISVALQQSWEKTYDDLYQIGRKKCRMPNDTLVYSAYLKEHDFIEEKQRKDIDGTKLRIADIVDEFPDDILLIHCTGHIVVAIQGMLIDTWDCSEYKAGRFWRLPVKDEDKLDDYLFETKIIDLDED